MRKVAIIDCGIGNRESIKNMLRVIGAKPIITANADEILAAERIILPGVGAFDAFMSALHQSKLFKVLENAVFNHKIPLLGICLGMQVLFEKSEEGQLQGLGWVSGKVMHLSYLFNDNKAIKLPHIGWKKVLPLSNKLIEDENKFYFVHNYFCQPINKSCISGKIEIHGKEVAVAVQQGCIYGAQFHPEKSHRYGMEFLKRFIDGPL